MPPLGSVSFEPSTPTAFPSVSPEPSPAPHRKKGRDRDYSFDGAAETSLIVIFVLAVVLPLLYSFWYVCLMRYPLPDMGGKWASEWYDARRGQTYGIAIVATLLNLMALIVAVLAAADDEATLQNFGLAIIKSKHEALYVGLLGFAYTRRDKARAYYAFEDRLPDDDAVDYDYHWLAHCESFGKATYGMLIPAAIVKLLGVFVVYKRAYAAHDRAFYRFLGTVVEFACFLMLLGTIVEFYSTCYRAMPNAGTEIFFPDPDQGADDGFDEKKLQVVAPYVCSILILVAAFASLLVSWIHFRTPCWGSELVVPEY